MNNKIKFTVFSLVALATVGTIAVGTAPFIFSGLAEEAKPVVNYKQTFTKLDDVEGGKALTTKLGNAIKVTGTKATYPESGIITLQKDGQFSFATAMGGIIKINVNLAIDGVDYVPDSAKPAPLLLEAGYLTKQDDITSPVYWVKAHDGFRSEYEWGKNYAKDTPSFLRFTSTVDKLTIKDLKIEYNCKHLGSENLSEQGQTYIVGSFQDSYAYTTNTGIKTKREGVQVEAYDVELRKGDIVKFKIPLNQCFDKLNLCKGKDGESAVNDGAIVASGTAGDALEIKVTGKYNFFLKDINNDKRDLYVDYKKGASNYKDWYLVGDKLTVGDKTFENQPDGTKPGWDLVPELKLTVTADNENVYKIENVLIEAGKGFKVRGKDAGLFEWNNFVDEESKTLLSQYGEAKDLKVKETAYYTITISTDIGVSINVKKVKDLVYDGYFVKDNTGNVVKFVDDGNSTDGKHQFKAVIMGTKDSGKFSFIGTYFEGKEISWSQDKSDIVKNGNVTLNGDKSANVVSYGEYTLYVVEDSTTQVSMYGTYKSN